MSRSRARLGCPSARPAAVPDPQRGGPKPAQNRSNSPLLNNKRRSNLLPPEEGYTLPHNQIMMQLIFHCLSCLASESYIHIFKVFMGKKAFLSPPPASGIVFLCAAANKNIWDAFFTQQQIRIFGTHFSHKGPYKGVLRPRGFQRQSLYRRGRGEEGAGLPLSPRWHVQPSGTLPALPFLKV